MKIKAVRTSLYDIPPEVERVDAIQTFVSMEFPFIEIEDADGVVGTGFSYTIGKGGEAIMPRAAARDVHELSLSF